MDLRDLDEVPDGDRPNAPKEVAMMTTAAKSDQTHPGMPLMAEPLLIDQFMPTYDLAVVYSRVFCAPPEQCFGAIANFDLLQLPAFRVLVGARGLPQRLADAVRRRADQAGGSAPPTFRLRDMPSMGWMLLASGPGRADLRPGRQTLEAPWRLAQ